MIRIGGSSVVDVTITATIGVDVVLGGFVFLIINSDGLTRTQGADVDISIGEWVLDFYIGESCVAVVGDDELIGNELICGSDRCIGAPAININDLLINGEIRILNNRNFF